MVREPTVFKTRHSSVVPHLLGDVCPNEFRDKIELASATSLEFKVAEKRLMKLAGGSDRSEISREETSYWANFTKGEAQLMISLRRKVEQTRRALTKKIENAVRHEFGFKNVGEGWISETLLYQIVRQILSSYELLRHHRPKWLNALELDIYPQSQGSP